MVEKRGAICLVSGGVDSVTMLYYVLHSFKPLDTLVIFCNYGQRTFNEEHYCISKICESLNLKMKTIDITWLGEISTSLLVKKDI